MKKGSFIVIIFLLIWAPNLYSETAVDLFNKGEKAYNQKNWDDSLYFYKKSLEKNPYFTKAFLQIVKINLHQVNNDQEAKKYLDKLLKTDPKNMEALDLQGKMLIKQGKLEEALKTYNKMIDIHPLDYIAINGLANVYIKMKFYSQAIKYMDKLLKIDKKRLDGYLTYANYYIIKADYDNAEKILTKAEYYNPNNGKIFYHYGLIYDKLNNHKKAKEYYEKALARNPDNKDIILNLSDIYFALRDWDRTITFIENSLNIYPDAALLLNKLSLAHFFNNNDNKALTNFHKTYKLNTTDDIVQFQLENLLISKKSFYDDERKKFSGMHFKIAENFDKNFYRYDSLYQYKRGLQIHAQDWNQRLNLANLYKRLGFLEKYIKELKISILLKPDNQLLKDKLEKTVTYLPKRLSYKLKINQYEIEKDTHKVFIAAFNSIDNNFIHNQTGKIAADMINNHMNLYNKFKLIDYNNENTDLYFNMQRNEIKKLAKKNKTDHYVFGVFRENGDYLSVEFQLYPVNGDEPIKKFSSIFRGKDKLYLIGKDIASQLNDFFQVKGRVMRIKADNNLIINLGMDDGLKIDDKIEIHDKGSISKDFNLNRYNKQESKKIATAKIIKIDEQLAEAELEEKDFINKVSVDDKLYLIRETKDKKEGTQKGN